MARAARATESWAFGPCLVVFLTLIGSIIEAQTVADDLKWDPILQSWGDKSRCLRHIAENRVRDSCVHSDNYLKLVERLKEGDTSVSVTALRWTYSQSPCFDPYYLVLNGLRVNLMNAINAERYSEAMNIAAALLEKNYCDIAAHMGAAICFLVVGDTAQSRFHSNLVTRLRASIALSSGDGLSHETAIHVILVKEEYDFLRWLGFELEQQSLAEIDGHQYDVMTVKNPSEGRTFDLYFNVDVPWNALQRMIDECKDLSLDQQ